MRQRITFTESMAARAELIRGQRVILAYDLDACIPFGPMYGHYKREMHRAIVELEHIAYYNVARRERRRRNP